MAAEELSHKSGKIGSALHFYYQKWGVCAPQHEPAIAEQWVELLIEAGT